MIASDVDGTILDYFGLPGTKPVLNQVLVREWRRLGVKQIALCTNQGGLPFGLAGIKRSAGIPYPTPEIHLWRLISLRHWLWEVGIGVGAIRISLFHPSATRLMLGRAERRLRVLLTQPQFAPLGASDLVIYTTERARKPNGLMLNSVGAEVFYGDSTDDEGAALAAGVPFVKVERFMG